MAIEMIVDQWNPSLCFAKTLSAFEINSIRIAFHSQAKVFALNERHLKRLLCEYISYHHEDRTHLGLGNETPAGRIRSMPSGRIVAHARLGGLRHRYDRAA
jgi:hypothetical protein